MRIILLCLAVVSVTLSACGPPSQAEHSVDYYRAHDQERRDQLLKCRKDPGTYGHTPNCVNVFEAERLEGIGSFKSLPPMEMPSTTPPGPGKP